MDRVIFLHIPKTAGQTVHYFLEYLFGKDNISPTRVNEHLYKYSTQELQRYKVFSGHLDWCMLDFLSGKKFIFTVIRDPLDRILSFYFYLRKKAETLPSSELKKPQNKGLWAALNLPVDEYFSGGSPGLRTFLDNHYDNFYTYYFAGRRYDARQYIKPLIMKGELNNNKVIDMAIDNLKSVNVYHINNLEKLYKDLIKISGKENDVEIQKFLSIQINKNKSVPNKLEDRLDLLSSIGASKRTFKKLVEFCELDYKLLNLLNLKMPGYSVWLELKSLY